MRKLKRYISRIVSSAVFVVLLVIVALDTLSAIVDQLDDLSEHYGILDVMFSVLLELPASIYEYIPLSCLVGCLIGLGMLASSSELVVIRAAGVNIRQIVWAVMRPILLFIVGGVLLGEYVSPYSNQLADSYKTLKQEGKASAHARHGHWHREREGNEYMHFNAVLPNGKLYGITRYQFNDSGVLVETSYVESAIHQGDYWFEENGIVTSFNQEKIEQFTFNTREWHTQVSPDLLNVLVLDTQDLPMNRLKRQADYLDKQGLDSSEYRLIFWRKALQPLATASLVIIAISFILGPLRQTTMGFRVFVGIIVGLIFQSSQQILAPTSYLMGFSPMYAVLIPIAISFLLGVALIKKAQ